MQRETPGLAVAGAGEPGAGSVGEEIYALAAQLYPICRSITGDGVRETLALLARHLPLETHEVPTGTAVFDWTIPDEWAIREAHITAPDGRRVVCFSRSNLHVVSYSRAIDARMPLAELKRHIFTLPDQPDLIPYRTAYYEPMWGFCMSHKVLAALPEGEYTVLIDAEHQPGALTYGEYLHRGETEEEVLLSAHICHPSLANDNCSGLALLAHLAARLGQRRTRHSYRFVFAPGTIGAIAWLSRNEARIGRIKHGLVVSCVGDGGGPNYKRSRRGDAMIDRAMSHVLSRNPNAAVIAFSPYGYDERQYCSPGFDLPVGLFQRSRHGAFPEYHTSADNLDFIAPRHLSQSFDIIMDALDIVERDRRCINVNPKCEPQLGRRALYSTIGGDARAPELSMAMLWVLNLSDGRHGLLDIAERAGLPFAVIDDAAVLLTEHGLLRGAGSAC